MLYGAIKTKSDDIKEVRHKNGIVWKSNVKPKVFILGVQHEVGTDDIETCIQTSDLEIAGKFDTASQSQTAVYNDEQQAVLDCYKTNKNIIVVIGFVDSRLSRLYAETFKNGSFSGPLAGIALKLKTYSIFEPEIKDRCDPDVYEENMELFEMAADVDGIHEELKAIRGDR